MFAIILQKSLKAEFFIIDQQLIVCNTLLKSICEIYLN